MPKLLPTLLMGALLFSPAAAKPPKKLIRSGEPCIGVPAITTHEVAMVVRANRYRLQECYRKALKTSPQLSGKLTARFLLTDQGSRVTIKDSTLGHKKFKQCVLRALQKFRFPPLRYHIGQKVDVTYPFLFRPDNPDDRPRPILVHYREGITPAVEKNDKSVTITLPAGGREKLTAANPGYRLIQSGDLAGSSLPRPFAAVSNFDSTEGDDLAVVLIHKEVPGRWRLVVLHHHEGGCQPVTVTDIETMEPYFKEKSGRPPGYFITKEARCFCEHRCLSVASSLAKAYEFEWDGEKYAGRLVDYLVPEE